MPKKGDDSWSKIGVWSFIVGLLLAIVAGFLWPMPSAGTVSILGVLGILVGLLNVSDKELTQYMLASLTFLVAATSLLGVVAVIPDVLKVIEPILSNIVVFVGPGAAVVGLKALYNVSKE